jgi:hypothetical protein
MSQEFNGSQIYTNDTSQDAIELCESMESVYERYSHATRIEFINIYVEQLNEFNAQNYDKDFVGVITMEDIIFIYNHSNIVDAMNMVKKSKLEFNIGNLVIY